MKLGILKGLLYYKYYPCLFNGGFQLNEKILFLGNFKLNYLMLYVKLK